jgi:hypothetical protein
MSSELVAKSVTEATIGAPLADIDLTEWVFTITDSEYQACSKNHIAAAASRTAEGKRMSLNVEHVGNLMVQHYVEEISERAHCRLVSTSESIGPDINSRTKVIVIWSFTAEAIDAHSTKFTNTDAFDPGISGSSENAGRTVLQGLRSGASGGERPQCRRDAVVRQGYRA